MAKNNFQVHKEQNVISMERVFAAPRDLIWKAYTDPVCIPRWWGPERYTTRVEAMEVATGGAWRYVNIGEKGEEYVFYGVYTDVKKPESISWTFNFELIGPGHEVKQTVRFEALGPDKTRVTNVSNYTSLKELQGMLGSGTESSAAETWDRLERLLATMNE